MGSEVNWAALPRDIRGVVWLRTMGKSMAEAAEEMGLSPSYLSRVLAGKRAPQHVIDLILEYGAPAGLFSGEDGDGEDSAA
jgi:transcriptional regulator with XRE-family HTH domain